MSDPQRILRAETQSVVADGNCISFKSTKHSGHPWGNPTATGSLGGGV